MDETSVRVVRAVARGGLHGYAVIAISTLAPISTRLERRDCAEPCEAIIVIYGRLSRSNGSSKAIKVD